MKEVIASDAGEKEEEQQRRKCISLAIVPSLQVSEGKLLLTVGPMKLQFPR